MGIATEESARATAGTGYLALIGRFPLRPIRSDAELELAIAVIHDLLDRDDLKPDEDDYLEVLGDQVAKYESEAHPVPGVSVSEMLRFLMRSNGLTQAELAAGTNIHATTISQILSGKRHLTVTQIHALADYFGLGPMAFLAKREVDPKHVEENATSLSRMAHRTSTRLGGKLTADQVVAVANSFGAEPGPPWRAFQEMVRRERPGTPLNQIADRLNHWGDAQAGCGFVPFEVTEEIVRALAEAMSDDTPSWDEFREIVESAIPGFSDLRKEFAKEN